VLSSFRCLGPFLGSARRPSGEAHTSQPRECRRDTKGSGTPLTAAIRGSESGWLSKKRRFTCCVAVAKSKGVAEACRDASGVTGSVSLLGPIPNRAGAARGRTYAVLASMYSVVWLANRRVGAPAGRREGVLSLPVAGRKFLTAV
jgi:hypothetical protein